jgi:uncharacterized protein
MENIFSALMTPLGGQGYVLILLMGFTALGSFVISGFGVGGGVLMTPLFLLFLPPKEGIALLAPLMVLISVMALRQYWRQWNNFHILVLLPAGLAGIWLGTHLLAICPPIYITKTVGVLAILFGVLQYVGVDRPEWFNRLRPGTWWGVGLGLSSGVSSGMAHAGGIIFSFYLLPNSASKETFIATTVFLFFVTGLLKIGTYAAYRILTWPLLLTSLLLIPALIAGSFLGKWMNRRLSNTQFLLLISILIVLMGLKLLIH